MIYKNKNLMNENIDLTVILKDCPIGWEFYSSIFGNVTFRRIENDSKYPIKYLTLDKDDFKRENSVSEQGFYYSEYNGECTFFPSKDQRDWSKFTAPWHNYKNENYEKEKFDPKSLRPFNQVLVRANLGATWFCTTFSHIRIKTPAYPYHTASGMYPYCIPYNEDTKNLVGTKDEPSDYYRYWEES